LRVQELVRTKAIEADINPETVCVFENGVDDDGFPFVENGEDHEPLILGITTMKLMHNIIALQAQEAFLIFHLGAAFKLSNLGYPVITCEFTDRSRRYHLAALFSVSQRIQSEYHEALGAFT
jgi:hypothetical protein